MKFYYISENKVKQKSKKPIKFNLCESKNISYQLFNNIFFYMNEMSNCIDNNR